MTLFVGTSGWAYKEWKPDFYPQELPQKSFLIHYSSILSACEINATFYRLQSEETLRGWVERTPVSFRFATKAHRRITHGRRIAPWSGDGDDDERAFFAAYLRSVAVLGDRLGAVLFQFPPYRHRDRDGLERLLDALPSGLAFACEFRHESWQDDDVNALISARGGTVCVSNTDGSVPEHLPAGPLAYVRLRTDRYEPQARRAWRDLLVTEAAHRDVFAFAKHEGIPTGDPYGGIGLAVWLAKDVGGNATATPADASLDTTA